MLCLLVPSVKHADTLARYLTVLVADDDEDIRSLVAATFREDGHLVLEAGDGAHVLAYLEEALGDPRVCPDVVLTDIRMPGLSGLGVLLALHRAQIHLPVVLMTVMADESVIILAKRLGAAGVLHKPFDAAGLRAAVTHAVAACAESLEPTSV